MASKHPTLPTAQRQQPQVAPAPAPRGPNRSTKASQKLKVLPEEPESLPTQSKVLKNERGEGEEEVSDDDEEDEPEEEDDVQVYKQLAQIPAGSARRDAMRLTRKEKARLPRVTAYCTATSYRLPALLEHLQSRRSTHLTNPIQFDEVIYTSYSWPSVPTHGSFASSSRGGSNLNPANHQHSSSVEPLVDISEEGPHEDHPVSAEKKKKKPRFAVDSELSGDEDGGRERTHPVEGAGKRTKAEVFLFEYGVVVIWGMSLEEEKRFLSSLKRFSVERLAPEDIEEEDLGFYYASYSRVYNDVITLKKGSSYMTKLSLSHALAQSVKLSFFEGAVSNTIDQTKHIPEEISTSGKIGLPRVEIMKHIGRLFILRVNISLVGSMIDSPELFWSFPDLEPLYGAFKTYLEVPQRLNVINARVDVLQDMLRLLKESVNSAHGEGLELVVIYLIVIEIILGVTTIAVDLFV
ncbi:hypothetical protein BDY24DRAFT_380627 [Mrakia frigida]|uniref:RMD1 family protein n=1 Tax=Mrakia frigida TaxID=29902 RepID=UPI003FCBF2DE